ITLNSTASLGAGAGSELIVSGNILQSNGLPSNSQLIKIGAGTVSLVSPINTTIPIAVQEGTLLVQGQGNLGSGQGSLISVSTSVPTSPATLALAGNKTISNRTLSLDGLGVAGAGALRSISGNNTWAGNINLAGTMQLAYVGIDTGRLTLSGRIDGGSSTLHKTGAGDLVISGNGNSQGSTVVGSGPLYQLGSDNVPVFVNSSGTLTGNGRLGVLRMTAGQNGTVTPGTLTSNVAILNTGGINAQSSVGVFQFDINSQALNGTSPAAGVAYDQLNVTGNVNLMGSPVLSLNLNFQPTVRGITYTIINNDGSDAVVGTFNGLAEGAYITANNVSYQISYNGGDGNDVTLTCVGIVTSNVLTSSDIDNLTKYGQPVTFTSVVSPPVGYSGNVSGTVQFMDQGLPIGAPVTVSGGSASITITNLSVNGSPHVITAVFNGGSSIFANSNSNIIAHTVTKANSSITVSSPTPVYGTDLPLEITATI
ncbi:MAG: Ig-like domain repeat protein, partial [Planctomycetia bacterium]